MQTFTVPRDSLWKGLIEDLFPDFLMYFYPDWASKNVDFDKGFEFLDHELDMLYPAGESGKRFADKLVKTHLNTGQEQWMLIHIEVQGYTDPDFPLRMFTYFYRIRDRWHNDIMAMSILTDGVKSFHPKQYTYQRGGTSLRYRFDTFKILEKSFEELEKPGNPFSVAMLTAKNALGKTDDKAMAIWKIALVRKMFKEGYPEERIRRLLDFIRFYVNFGKPDAEQDFLKEVQTLTQTRTHMGIEETIRKELEIYAKKEGRKEGRKEGKEEGMKEGMKKGEHKKAIETAETCLKEGLSVELTTKISKLSLVEVKAIANRLGLNPS